MKKMKRNIAKKNMKLCQRKKSSEMRMKYKLTVSIRKK